MFCFHTLFSHHGVQTNDKIRIVFTLTTYFIDLMFSHIQKYSWTYRNWVIQSLIVPLYISFRFLNLTFMTWNLEWKNSLWIDAIASKNSYRSCLKTTTKIVDVVCVTPYPCIHNTQRLVYFDSNGMKLLNVQHCTNGNQSYFIRSSFQNAFVIYNQSQSIIY